MKRKRRVHLFRKTGCGKVEAKNTATSFLGLSHSRGARLRPVALSPTPPETRPDPQAVAVLDIQYFGPNGEPIPDRQEQVFWTDLTGERDGFGQAISAALTTPRFASMLKSSILLDRAQALYDALVQLKTERLAQLVPDDEAESANTSSARINRIQQRIRSLPSLPEGSVPDKKWS